MFLFGESIVVVNTHKPQDVLDVPTHLSPDFHYVSADSECNHKLIVFYQKTQSMCTALIVTNEMLEIKSDKTTNQQNICGFQFNCNCILLYYPGIVYIKYQ